MNDLQDFLVKTMNDDGIESVPVGKEKPALTIIIGGCNSVHANNVVQINAEKLPETGTNLRRDNLWGRLFGLW